MAGAMVQGLLRSGACAPADITVIGGNDSTAADLSKVTGVRVAATPTELLVGADAVVLACKPQQFAALDKSYASLAQGKLVLSILAGTRLATIGAFFSSARNVARAMPNTPGESVRVSARVARRPRSRSPMPRLSTQSSRVSAQS